MAFLCSILHLDKHIFQSIVVSILIRHYPIILVTLVFSYWPLLLCNPSQYKNIFQESIFAITHSSERTESMETYGQTRGLSKLEMKQVGKLAIIGALLNAVKTSCVHTMQVRTIVIL